jgi:ParB-like chromosome segregation protein Spo0J
MTTMTISNMDLRPAAEVKDSRVVTCGNSDPLSMIDQLPEVSVPVSSLVPGFYLRQAGTDATHVRLLADAASAVKLPPILVQKRGLRIIDGMHRVEAAKLRGKWDVCARIVDCADEEALVLAVKSNTLHGLPLSRNDRISGAKRILATHPDWSDRSVAEVTGLSAKSIASLRNASTGDAQFCGKRLGRDGKRRPVAGADGRHRAAEYINAHPEASLREVARETDVSLGTAHDVRDRIRRGVDYATGKSALTDERRAEGSDKDVTVSSRFTARSISIRPDTSNVKQLAWSAVSPKLANDPSLRYTEGGRAFVRWMAKHSMQADEWREFVDAIPQYWLENVCEIAAGMRDEWRLFAEQLINKQQEAS